jgi:decaprenylphospho-beta-D-ribofuranose 2-oxidase
MLQDIYEILSVSKYQNHLTTLKPESNVHLHYGWLRCTKERFFEDVLSVDYKLESEHSTPYVETSLVDESWGTSELLRAGWDLARKDDQFKQLIWKELTYDGVEGQKTTESRLAWMRASVSFTASRGDDSGVDILQEYFVPTARLSEMIEKLKTLFTTQNVNALSSTIRLVRPDHLTNLSYCPVSDFASIAVDAHVGVKDNAGLREPDDAAKKWINEAIDTSIALGGSYYLPYYKVADVKKFKTAYSAKGIALQADAIKKFNPKKIFWNSFLQKYFSYA